MTRTATNINQIPDQDRLEVIDACNEAIRTDSLISVQLEDFDRGDDYETTVYGVYVNDVDWVENYYRSGGIWEYCDPERFLRG